MKNKFHFFSVVCAALVINAPAGDTTTMPKENVFPAKPLGITLSIKMVGPYMEPADLQIICLFKHKQTGDTYQGAAKETDEKLGGILSSLRNRGEFAGETGETFLLTPPKGSIPARQFMVIGLGEEKDLSLDTLRIVGRIAAREAVRLKAKHVAWAPVIRDEGNTAIDVGEGDRAFAEEMLSSYDTEKRLQAQEAKITAERSPFGWRCEEKGVQSIYIPTWLRYHRVSWNPAVKRYCRARLQNFDIVHIFGLYDLLGPAVTAASRKRGLPYVLEPIGMFVPIVRNLWLKRMYHAVWGRRLLEGASAVIATSEREAEEQIGRAHV